MASAAATENRFVHQICEDLSFDEFSNIESSLLMSLLEGSQAEDGYDQRQAEDGDDEMLRAMIQSLELEIMNQDSCSETDSSEDYSFSEERYSTSPDHQPDFEWIDMQMEMEMQMTGYFTSRFTGNMVALGGLEEDYSQVCYGMPMEEDDCIGLWQ